MGLTFFQKICQREQLEHRAFAHHHGVVQSVGAVGGAYMHVYL